MTGNISIAVCLSSFVRMAMIDEKWHWQVFFSSNGRPVAPRPPAGILPAKGGGAAALEHLWQYENRSEIWLRTFSVIILLIPYRFTCQNQAHLSTTGIFLHYKTLCVRNVRVCIKLCIVAWRHRVCMHVCLCACMHVQMVRAYNLCAKRPYWGDNCPRGLAQMLETSVALPRTASDHPLATGSVAKGVEQH